MADQSSRRSWALPIALGLTGIWALLAVWLLTHTSVCDTAPTWQLWEYLDCYSPNEVGDFLAGIFAPLAFLWLATAVFIQQNELAAQRQELRDSRKVALQQVAEARRNVTYISEQTKMLVDQRQRAEHLETDTDIEELLSLFCKIFEQDISYFKIDDGASDTDPWGTNAFRYVFPLVPEMRDKIEEAYKCVEQVREAERVAVGISDNDASHLVYTLDQNALDSAAEIMDSISEMGVTASPPMKARLDRRSVSDFAEDLRRFNGFLSSNGRPIVLPQ